MTADLPIGAEHEIEITVTPEMAAPHLGPAGAVLSTPSMIGLMEQCCALALAPALAAGESSEPLAVCITHDAACRVGDRVVVRARLVERDGARLVWEVEAIGPDDRRLGGGTLERVVVEAEAQPG